MSGVPNPCPASLIQPSMTIHHFFMLTVNKYHCNGKWNSLIFCVQKSKFFACHIFDFYKDLTLPSGLFPKLITHIQQIASTFDTTYLSEQLFSKMITTKRMLHSQVWNRHLSNLLLPSISSFNPDVISFCDCKQHQMSRYKIIIVTVFSVLLRSHLWPSDWKSRGFLANLSRKNISQILK